MEFLLILVKQNMLKRKLIIKNNILKTFLWFILFILFVISDSRIYAISQNNELTGPSVKETISLLRSSRDFCMDLHYGANLISFYMLPEDLSVANIMSSIEGIATDIIGEQIPYKSSI